MKKSLLTTLSLLVCVLAMAEPISSKKALEIATSYLAKSGVPRRAATQMSVQPFQTDRQGNPLMYAVNNGGDGYVIAPKCYPVSRIRKNPITTTAPRTAKTPR